MIFQDHGQWSGSGHHIASAKAKGLPFNEGAATNVISVAPASAWQPGVVLYSLAY